MKIWLVSIFEQTPIDETPTTRFNTIADIAVKRGHQVTYFASTFKHNTKKFRFSDTREILKSEKLKLVYLKSNAYSENISLYRLYSHYKYAKDLIKHYERLDKPDLILVAFPPISIAYEVSKWAKKNKVPVVMDIIDPWPDLFENKLNFFPRFIRFFLLAPLRKRVKDTIQNLDGVVAISNQYLDWAGSYFPGLKSRKCFYPAVSLQETQKELSVISKKIYKSKEKFTVVYAGSLASSYDIKTILKTAALLEESHKDQIRFIIAGSGPQENLIKAYEKSHTNLLYKGRLSRSQLLEVYFISDLGLTQHIEGATQSVTYKLFDLLSCGLPILNSLDSEMKDIILDNNVGTFNEPGDHVTLAEQIINFYNDPNKLKEYKQNAIHLTRMIGDSNLVYDQYLQYLESIFNEYNI